jgi:hypothetical protein
MHVGQGVKLTVQLHLVLRLRMMKLYLSALLPFHPMVLNELSTGVAYL